LPLPDANNKKGFVLLPRCWGVERSFAWTARSRGLGRDFERNPEVLRGIHYIAFAILILHNFVNSIAPFGESALQPSAN
jgi:hypothetical protein